MPELARGLRISKAETRSAEPIRGAAQAETKQDWRLGLVLIATVAAGSVSILLGTIAGLANYEWGSALAFTGLATISAAGASWGIARKFGTEIALHVLFIVGGAAMALDSWLLRPAQAGDVSLISPLLAAVGALMLMPIQRAAPYVAVAAIGQILLLSRAGVPPTPWISTFLSITLFVSIASYRRDKIEKEMTVRAAQQDKARREVSAILDQVPEAFALLAPDGHRLRWNQKFDEFCIELTGHTAAADPNGEAFLPAEMVARIREAIRLASAGNIVTVDFESTTVTPPRHWQAVLTPYHLDEGAGTLMQLTERTNPSAVQSQRAIKLEESRARMLKVSSRELLEPLPPIEAELQRFERNEFAALPEDQADSLDTIVAGVRKLTRHANNLAAVYQMELSPPQAQPDTSLIASILDAAATEIQTNHSFPVPKIGSVDPALRAHVDADLLRNAIVYSVEYIDKVQLLDGAVAMDARINEDSLVIHLGSNATIDAPTTPIELDATGIEPASRHLPPAVPLLLAKHCMAAMNGRLDTCEPHAEQCFALIIPLANRVAKQPPFGASEPLEFSEPPPARPILRGRRP